MFDFYLWVRARWAELRLGGGNLSECGGEFVDESFELLDSPF